MFRNQLMDLKVSPPWAVVLAVCVVGFLSTCATGAPLILQLDPTTLVGHRLVIAIEPLPLEGVTHMKIESNISVDLLNSTADATNASIIFFGSNNVDTPVTSDALEMVSADVTTTEAGPPPTSTPAVMVNSQTTTKGFASQPLLRSEKYAIFADDDQLSNHISDYPAQDFPTKRLDISLRSRTQTRLPDQDDVDNFLINFPRRCPEGWRDDHGQCRRPFNGFNKIAKSRSKAMIKHKFK